MFKPGIRTGVSTLAASALLFAGCGGSSNPTATFKSGYVALRAPLNQTGTAIAQAITIAPNDSNAELAHVFTQLADRLQAQLKKLKALKPPANLASRFATLTAAAERVETDLRAIAAAGATNNPTAGRAAGEALARDASAESSAGATFKQKLGIK